MGKLLKRNLTYLFFTKGNEIYICHLDIQNHVSYKKWCKYKYFAYKLTHNVSDTLWATEGKIFKRILTYLYCTKHNEINMCHLYLHENVFHKKMA